MQKGMLWGNDSANDSPARRALHQAGAGLPGSSRTANSESLIGKRTGRLPKMITSLGDAPPEKWRRRAKVIMVIEGDHAKKGILRETIQQMVHPQAWPIAPAER